MTGEQKTVHFFILLKMLIWALFIDIAPAKGGQKHIFRISRRDGQVLLEAAAETVEVYTIIMTTAHKVCNIIKL